MNFKDYLYEATTPKNLKDFMRELDKYRNPLTGRGWVFQFKDGGFVQVDGNIFEDSFYFNIITSEEHRGKGFANAVLNFLTKLADKHKVKLRLEASPFGNSKPMSASQLKTWYKKNGFIFKGDTGIREPK